MNGVVVLVSKKAAGRALEGFAETAREAGLSPALVTTGGAVAGALRDPADLFDLVGVTNDLTSAREVADCARGIAGDRLAAIVSWNDSTITVAAYAAELAGVARTPADAIARTRNKHAMREALTAAGVATPPFALISAEEEVPAVAAVVGFPAIIKPVNGTGSSLVRAVGSEDELAAAYRELRASAHEAADGMLCEPVVVPGGEPLDATRQFLVERELRGREYDAEIAVRDGVVEITLLMRVMVQEKTFFGCGYVHPPVGLAPERRDEVVASLEKAVQACGIDNTTANVTVIDDEVLGPVLVEINAGRFGGQMIWRLVLDLTGVNLQALHLGLAAGLPPLASAGVTDDFSLAGVTVFAGEPGVVTGVRGLDELRAHPQVAYVSTFVEPGDVVLGHDAVYAVNAMVFGFHDEDELFALYREVCELVNVETRPLS